MKKKRLHNIFYAVSNETDEIRYIDEVERGAKSNCKCAACGEQMIANHGDNNRHFFSHISNFECLYAYEISIYRALYGALQDHQELMLPPMLLNFHSNKSDERIKDAASIVITEVNYTYEEKQYPPDLIVKVDNECLRLILDFGSTYSAEDIQSFTEISKESNTACLLITIQEDIGKLGKFDFDLMLIKSEDNKKWIYNRLIEKYRKKFQSVACIPKHMFSEGSYCSAMKHFYEGQPSARWVDCLECEFCIDISSNLCLAEQYINHIEDFKLSFDERRQKYWGKRDAFRNKRLADGLCPNCGGLIMKRIGKFGEFLGCNNYPNCMTQFIRDITTGTFKLK